MPITIRLTSNATILLAIGLILAACTTEARPVVETGSADDPTLAPPASSNQPPIATDTPTVEPEATAAPAIVLPDLGPAPDITNEVWLNTDQPLNLELLRGEVVLVEFWTFG